MKFCGLHNHTEYSNLKLRDCIVKIQDLVDRAISYDYNGIAITDHEILSGHIEAYKIGQKVKETHPDFKVILGNEIYLIDEHEYRNAPKYYHFILLAKDKIGYEQLRQLSSRAWRRAYMEKGMLRTPTFYQDINEVIKNDKGHLIASTACLGGLLDYAIVHKRTEEFNRFVQWGITTFGKDCFYLEMQDSDSDEQRIANTTIIRAAKHFGLNTIVTSDVHYLDAKDKEIHKAFLNSKEEDGRETEQFYKYTYLKKLDEIYRILSYLPKEEVTKAINNTQKVYEAIEDFSLLHPTIVPERKPAPFQLSHKLRPFYENYDAIRRFAESDYEQDRYLLYLIERGLDEKRIVPTPDIADRINTELDVVWCISEKLNQRLSAYLNLVRNIVDIIWEVSFVGVSRGCFLPDSKVLMADGSCKNIQDVRIGDKVYTHKGRIQEVYDTPRYEVDETMYRVSVSGREPFTCTDNHKIFALPQGECRAPGDKTVYCSKKCRRYDRCSHKTSFDTAPRWVEAQNLKKGDFVATPKYDTLSTQRKQLDLLDYIPNARLIDENTVYYKDDTHKMSGYNARYKVNRYVPITPNFARLVGYFIGNGWTAQPKRGCYKTGIAFHSDHKDKIEDCVHLMEECMGVTPSLIYHKTRHSVQIMAYGKWFTCMFRALCGENSHSKRIPDIFNTVPLMRELVIGLMRTDGNIDLRRRRAKYSTISPVLAYQVHTLLNRLGYNSSLFVNKKQQENWSPERGIRISGKNFLRFCKDFGFGEPTLPSYAGQDFYEDDCYYYHRVRSVGPVPYRGVVYDLSVKYDTSYIINGCAVHNSAASFYINYLIGITQMNPMLYNVPYWRFANKERADMMDIDIDVNPDKVPEIIDRLRAYYGEDNVLNCLTFKTESLKSAILTAARGLGVNNDDAQAIATLVPVERGKVASFKECTVGDAEKGIEPVVGFTAALQRHPRLYETVEKIEGIISGRGIHASALYIFNEGYIAHNSLMRAPNQTLITAFNMHDSDSMGALKFDLLSTALQTKLMKCMELLLADGVIHWQGSLRATYNKYLHPDVIRYDDPKLWEAMATGRVLNLFQFETPVGGVCIRKARPQNVKQLASANAVMRLMAQEGQEAPMERYVRFRNNIQKWYDEMTQYGLTEHEQGILKSILADSFGVGPQQEEMMLLVQHPEIADFTLAEANKLRKAVSKKDSKTIEEMREKFFAKAGTGTCGRREFLDYIYEKNIAPQIGYAFSIPHTVAYSIEALQQANLALYYNPLYWQCACLSVNAGVMETALENYDIEVVSPSRYPKKELPPEEEVQITEEGYEKRPPQRTTDYGKLARALGEMHSIGVKILLPDINKARLDFSPDVHRNAILFGLKAITGINDETAKSIILYRPYTSLRQFTEKLDINRFQIINLIKAGAFDELEKRPRRQIMESYLYSDVAVQVPLLKTLTTAQLEKCVQGKFLPSEYADQAKMIFFQKWIKAHNLTSTNNRWYYVLEDEDTLKFFNAYFKHKLTQESDFTVVSGSVTVKRPALDKLIEESVTPLKTWFKSPTATNAYRDYIIAEKLTALTDRVCAGSLGRWEMESLSCYYTEHELAHFDRIKYDISDFNAMPEEPIAIGYRTDKTTGASIPVYRIQNIAGTVLKVDRMRRIVTILTTTGVVDVKFSYSAFALYSRQISVLCFRIKKVIDGAWLARGEKLIIAGYRKDNMFTARRDYSDPSSRVVKRIVVTPAGGFEIIKDREKGDSQ